MDAKDKTRGVCELFDEFAYKNGLEPAFINAPEVLNLPALVHLLSFFSMLEVTMLHLVHLGVDLFLQIYGWTEKYVLKMWTQRKLEQAYSF